LLLLTASFAALTCDDGAKSVPLAEQIASAFCAHQFSCCSPFEISMVTNDRYATEADCVAFATLSARQQLGAIEGAAAQGRITMDPAKVEACMNAYRAQRCNGSVQTPVSLGALPNVGDFLARCPDLLVGHVPIDRACNFAQECARGSRCVGGAPTSSGMAGSFGGVPQTTTPTAGPGICVAYQKPGERCNDSSDCDQTMHLACRTPAFQCGPGPREGEPCTLVFDQFTGQVSSDCDSSLQLFCDQFSLTCRHLPREGEPCNQFVQSGCDPDPALGLSCNPVSGVCKRPGDEGAPCGGQGIPPCRPDLGCHPTQSDGIGVCGSMPGLGEACSDRCASPTVCVWGVCTMPGTVLQGAPCSADSQCTSLSCQGLTGSTRVCSVPQIFPTCVGSDINAGAIMGMGGIGGKGGFGGSSGFGGSFVTGGSSGRAGAGGAFTGMGGSIGGAGMPPLGCPVSDIPVGDPLIADFENAAAGMGVLPIGGTFVYPNMGGPTATVANGGWHVTATSLGLENPQYWGVGIFFSGNAGGTDCVDATAHRGVMFDISGSITGTGCSAQFAVNDSLHTDSTLDPKGSGPPGAYAPQAMLMISSLPTTVMMPFQGPSAPVGGNPVVAIDPARLTGVIWQFTTAGGVANNCAVDVTIDNVRFF